SKKYPELFSSAAGHKASQKDYGPAYIDDDTPTPEHAKFHWLRLAKLIFVAIALWLLPILALGAYLGWHHSYTQMAW
ncbi:chromate efflux transporter, partial [Klebsiella pneumoniae]